MFKRDEAIKITNSCELTTCLKNQTKNEQEYKIKSERFTITKSKSSDGYINTKTNQFFLNLPKNLPAKEYDDYVKTSSTACKYITKVAYSTRTMLVSILSKDMYVVTDYSKYKNPTLLVFREDCIPMKDELISKHKIKYNNYLKKQKQEKLLSQFIYPNLHEALKEIGLMYDENKGCIYSHYTSNDWIAQQLNKIIEDKIKEIGDNLGVDVKYKSNLKNFRITRKIAQLKFNVSD
jgi:hypothetical protein